MTIVTVGLSYEYSTRLVVFEVVRINFAYLASDEVSRLCKNRPWTSAIRSNSDQGSVLGGARSLLVFQGKPAQTHLWATPPEGRGHACVFRICRGSCCLVPHGFLNRNHDLNDPKNSDSS